MNSILPNANPNATEPDVILIGAGTMSATLSVLLKEVEPALTIAGSKRFRMGRSRRNGNRSHGRCRNRHRKPEASRLGAPARHVAST